VGLSSGLSSIYIYIYIAYGTWKNSGFSSIYSLWDLKNSGFSSIYSSWDLEKFQALLYLYIAIGQKNSGLSMSLMKSRALLASSIPFCRASSIGMSMGVA